MKMHTFFLSGKAIAIVSGALGAGGVLLFVSGVLVGVHAELGVGGASAARPVALAAPAATPTAGPAAESAAGAAASSTTPADSTRANGTAPATTTASSAPADAAWPFTASSYAPPASASDPAPAAALLPAAQDPAQDSAPTARAAPAPAPAPRDTVRARPGQRARISAVAYRPDDLPADEPAETTVMSTADVRDRDAGRYLVQVGTFRVEEHARDLVARLEAAGYHATVSVREEGDRALHVVRVSGFVGVDAAERAAAKIGGAEQLVAYVVPVTK